MQGNNNGCYVGFDLRTHHHHHHQQSPFTSHLNNNNPMQGPSSSSLVPPTIHENFPLTTQETHPLSLTDYNKPDQRANSASDEDDPSLNEDPESGHRGRKSTSQWQRVKWTDAMVRLLITAVSYITEEVGPEHGPRKKLANLHKKGKWKSISKVMAERGHLVSPQQCEDKFNDLNKRYKRLNEILGRGTSCEVVENPALLDLMDHVSEKAKDEVRKILSSKHLHYEEMCSYHNGNRLHLPPDPDLQHSLRLALRIREDQDEGNLKRHLNEENDEIDDREGGFDEHGGFEENLGKRVKQCPSHEEFSFKNSLGPFGGGDTGVSFLVENDNVCGEGAKTNVISQKNQAGHWNKLQLEEQRLHIEAQMLELEKEKFKWQRFCRKKDRELEVMRMDIERMKLENERMALEIRRWEMSLDDK
ncbi:sequence-specific DNA binding transcription factors [Striga hermonthica]|uniref:Sequence-specific DNA binding transcription factors n=1 Tax=Striga hermonthica TaxID=68872 RepID=A0A9N7MPN0_STRHE|nr:sequence-specific DNA binding transcription factors [Striga hermonthica]